MRTSHWAMALTFIWLQHTGLWGNLHCLFDQCLTQSTKMAETPPSSSSIKSTSLKRTHMSADKIHLCFVFNGINYYVPFFQQSVARVIRTGDPVLKNIMWASKDLKILMGKLPGKLSINAELKQVSMYMDAASKIIQNTHLTCCNSQAFETTTMELPGIDPFLEGTVRRCR